MNKILLAILFANSNEQSNNEHIQSNKDRRVGCENNLAPFFTNFTGTRILEKIV